MAKENRRATLAIGMLALADLVSANPGSVFGRGGCAGAICAFTREFMDSVEKSATPPGQSAHVGWQKLLEQRGMDVSDNQAKILDKVEEMAEKGPKNYCTNVVATIAASEIYKTPTKITSANLATLHWPVIAMTVTATMLKDLDFMPEQVKAGIAYGAFCAVRMACDGRAFLPTARAVAAFGIGAESVKAIKRASENKETRDAIESAFAGVMPRALRGGRDEIAR